MSLLRLVNVPNRSPFRLIAATVGALLAVGGVTLASLNIPVSPAGAARVKPTLNPDFHTVCTNVAANATRLTTGVNCRTMTFDGAARQYIVEVPAGVAPGSVRPVVFVFHGTSGNGGEFSLRPKAGWPVVGVREKAVLVYPTAMQLCALNPGVADTPGVHECRTGGGRALTRWSSYQSSRILDLDEVPRGYSGAWPPNDVGFFDAIVADLSASGVVPADPGLFVTGFSSGGCMAMTLAFERSTTVDAASVVAGCGPDTVNPPTRHIPIEYRIGTADPTLSASYGFVPPLPFEPAGFMSGIGVNLITPIVTKAGLDPTRYRASYAASSLPGRPQTATPKPNSKILAMTWTDAAPGNSGVRPVDVIVTKDIDHSYEGGLDQTPALEAWQFFTRSTR